MQIEIDSDSGFCFGVVTAIRKAEEALANSGNLYCLGDIVHNAAEVERLRKIGLETITHEDMEKLHDVKVLLRAHGEPPSTYELARRNNIEIIDATCPVVLQLQRRIRESYQEDEQSRSGGKNASALAPVETSATQILIYGKPGHAEVNGLVGQTSGKAIVIRDMSDLDGIDFSCPIRLYSQTTKSLTGFREIVKEIQRRVDALGAGDFQWFDTICRQVANRMDRIRDFAKTHDVVLFVSGAKSSNGKVLFAECQKVNENSYLISEPSQLKPEWLGGAESVGVCGATSTPRWLMAEVAQKAEEYAGRV